MYIHGKIRTEPGGDCNNLVNPKQQGDQDSVTTLVEVSEPECQVKSGRMPLEIGDTQRTEITEGTNPLRYPKEERKGAPRTMKLKADESSEPWALLEFSGKNTDHVKEPREQ